MKTHTPLPWSHSENQGCRNLIGADGEEIGYTVGQYDDDRDLANAQLICRAVNSHAELVAALQMIDAAYDSSAARGQPISQTLYAAVMDARRLLAVNGWTQPKSRQEVLSNEKGSQ